MNVAKPDGKRGRNQIVSDAMRERTGKRRDLLQVFGLCNHTTTTTLTFLHKLHSRESLRLQTLPCHLQSLMLLNKGFHREIAGYLYSGAVFDFGEDVEALLLFSIQTGLELASLIKHIRLEYVDRFGTSGRRGTNIFSPSSWPFVLGHIIRELPKSHNGRRI